MGNSCGLSSSRLLLTNRMSAISSKGAIRAGKSRPVTRSLASVDFVLRAGSIEESPNLDTKRVGRGRGEASKDCSRAEAAAPARDSAAQTACVSGEPPVWRARASPSHALPCHAFEKCVAGHGECVCVGCRACLSVPLPVATCLVSQRRSVHAAYSAGGQRVLCDPPCAL